MAQIIYEPNYKIIGNIDRILIPEDVLVPYKKLDLISFPIPLEKYPPAMQLFLKQVPSDFFEVGGIKSAIFFTYHIEYIPKDKSPRVNYWHFDAHSSIRNTRAIICNLSDNPNGVSNTQFLKAHIPFKNGLVANAEDYEEIRAYDKDLSNIFNTKDGQIIEFDSRTPHRSEPAKNEGWRLFMRLTQDC